MTNKIMHQICCSLYWSIKKWSKLGQKMDFLALFERFFVYAVLHPMSYTSRFCQLKDLIKIHICGKSFISIACAVVEFKIFKVFRIDSASWSGHFFGFSGLTPPNIDRSCWNFDQRLWDFVSNKTNTVFEKSIEILDFGSNVTHPKLTLLVHFGT